MGEGLFLQFGYARLIAKYNSRVCLCDIALSLDVPHDVCCKPVLHDKLFIAKELVGPLMPEVN